MAALFFKLSGHPTHILFPQPLSKPANLLGSLTVGQERLQNSVHGGADDDISVIHSPLTFPWLYSC